MENGLLGVAGALAGAIVTGIVRFSRVETRVESLEKSRDENGHKLDRALESLARIEGRFFEADRHYGS